MALTYDWKITGVKKGDSPSQNLTGVVIGTYWTLTGTNESGISGKFVGATPLKITDIDPNTFVPFEQLTEELVLSWVRPIVESDEFYMAHINAQINKEITKKTVNIENPPLPWANNETETPAPGGAIGENNE